MWNLSYYNWSNGSIDNQWPDTSSYTAEFGATGGTPTVMLGDNVTVGGLIFDGNYIINTQGYGIYFGNTNINVTLNNTPNVTLNGSLLNGSASFTGAGTVTLAGSIDNGGLGVTVGGNATVILDKPSSGSPNVHAVGGGGLTVNSSGTVQFSGSGTQQVYTGTYINLNSGGTIDFNGQSQDAVGQGFNVNGSSTLINSAASTSSSYTGTISVGGNILSAGGAGNLTLGTVSGSNGAGLVKIGSGTLTLTGSSDNSFLTCTVSAGTLVLAETGTGAYRAANGVTVDSGAELQFGGTGNQQIYTGANLIVSSGATFDFNGENQDSLGSGFSVGGNGIVVNGNAIGALINSNAGTTAAYGTSAQLGDSNGVTAAGNITLTADTLVAGAGNITLYGAISGAHSLTYGISGAPTGTLQLGVTGVGQTVNSNVASGNFNYSGSTTINGGILEFIDTAPNSSPTLNIASGSTLEFNVSTSVSVADGANVALGASGGTTVSGNGTFLKTGSGILALDGQGGGHAVSFDLGTPGSPGGLIDIEGGTLRNGGWSGGVWTSNYASLNIGANGTLDLWDGNTVIVDGLTGNGTVTHTTNGGSTTLEVGINNDISGTATFSGTITETSGHTTVLTKVGTGTQILSGANSYSGGTTINGGTLAAVGTGLGTGPVVVAGGTIAVNDGTTTTAQTLTTADQTWKASGGYTARIFNDGSSDQLQIIAGTSSLTIDGSVSTATPFTVTAGTTTLGSLDPTVTRDWVIASGITTVNGVTAPTVGDPTVLATAGQGASSSGFVLNVPSDLFSGSEANAPLLELEDSSGLYSLDIVYNAAPEPGTAMLLLGGAVPMLTSRRRRRQCRPWQHENL